MENSREGKKALPRHPKMVYKIGYDDVLRVQTRVELPIGLVGSRLSCIRHRSSSKSYVSGAIALDLVVA